MRQWACRAPRASLGHVAPLHVRRALLADPRRPPPCPTLLPHRQKKTMPGPVCSHGRKRVGEGAGVVVGVELDVPLEIAEGELDAVTSNLLDQKVAIVSVIASPSLGRMQPPLSNDLIVGARIIDFELPLDQGRFRSYPRLRTADNARTITSRSVRSGSETRPASCTTANFAFDRRPRYLRRNSVTSSTASWRSFPCPGG